MSLEEAEKIMDDTREGIEYQEVGLGVIFLLPCIPFFVRTLSATELIMCILLYF